jgi:ribosomal protein L40E
MALARVVDAQSQEKECRKCGALNKAQSQECYNCQVLFSKVEDLPLDPTLRAQPSLVRKWKLLLQNFDDISQHEAFLMSCHQLEALRFATLKYEEMRIENRRSPICDQMLRRIRAMSEVALMNRPPEVKKVSTWSRILMWSPYVLSLGLIVWGSSGLAHRNMVGLGVAIACLATGLILIVRGKLSHHDFMG